MKRIVTIVCVGFAAMTAQLLLARELMVVALGDELTVGLVFFAWMLWVGVGSAAGGMIFRNRAPSDATVGIITIVLGFLIPLSVLWARMQASLFGFHQGEIIPVDNVLLMSLASLFPVCVLAGLAFPMLCAKAESDGSEGVAGKIYAWDTLGSVIGGLAFSLFLVRYLGSLSCSFWAAGATILIGTAWLTKPARSALILLLLLSIITANIQTGFLRKGGTDFVSALDSSTRTIYWGSNHVRSYESPYGTITVLADEGQYSLFTSGRFAGNIPDRVFGEFTAHAPLLAHPDPKNIFVTGVSPTSITEMLKHGPEKITVAELDPMLLDLKKKYTSGKTGRAYEDPHVATVAEDPRRFLKNTDDKYDVIIIDAGAPENIQLNRYFTAEFFSILHHRLNPGGIVAMSVPFSDNYTGRDVAALLGTILITIDSAGGGQPMPVPGAKTFFLWRPGKELDVSPADASARFAERGISSEHFSTDSAAYYFDPTRVEFAFSQFSDNMLEYTMAADKIGSAFQWLKTRHGASVNKDVQPVCVYFQSRIRNSYYPSNMKNIIISIKDLANHRTIKYLLLLIAIGLAFMGRKKGTRRKITVSISIAIVGFVGISLEILLIAIFQAEFGVVYQFLGLIIASFLGGCATGSALCASLVKKSYRVCLMITQFALGFALLSIPLLFESSFGRSYLSSETYLIIAIIICIFSTGLAVGCSFPTAVFLFNSSSQNKSDSAGIIYAFDMFGACIGAFLISTVLFPVAGLWNTLIFLLFTGMCAMFGFASPFIFNKRGFDD